MSRVLIFGSGPAGLLVAHAAIQAGYSIRDVTIISSKPKSTIYGCQYLHAPIPGISDAPGAPDPRKVAYRLIGTPAEYRRKVYGGSHTGNVSVVDLDEEHMAWDVRYCYNKLFDIFCHRIFMGLVDPDIVHQSSWHSMRDSAKLIFSTIPRAAWCQANHTFDAQKIYAAGDAPELGIKSPVQAGEEDVVICNSSRDVGWYRLARVFGRTTVEWPGHSKKPPIQGVVPVSKPLLTNCDCLSGEVIFLGRFGQWKKGVLLHEVFEKAAAIFAADDASAQAEQYALF